MTAREELAQSIAANFDRMFGKCEFAPATQDYELADALLAEGWGKRRTVADYAKFDALPVGTAVQTSDADHVVVLKHAGCMFRNQDGHEVPADVLWRYGTHPFTVLYTPEPQS